MPAPPSITILGAGGIGCAVGAVLARAGVPVEFVDTSTVKIQRGRTDGVQIAGSPPVAATFTAASDWSPDPTGVILLCTKSHCNPTVLAQIPSAATLIPIQNGFDPLLQQRVAHEGIASFVSECEARRPLTRITRPGDLHVGSCGTGEPLPAAVVAILEDLDTHGAFTVKIVADVLPYKHTKLMYNAAISPLAAVTGLDNGALLTHPPARRLFFAFLRENYRILCAAGAPLGVIGPFHPDTVNRILRTPLLGTIMAGPFSRSLRGTYCSMSGDIATGATEVDHFNGHLVRLAGGQDCPHNQIACDLVHEMAKVRATPDLIHLQRWEAA